MKILREKLLWIFVLAIGFGLGFFVDQVVTNVREPSCDNGEFKYLNRDLICGRKFVIAKREYLSLKESLEQFVKEKVKDDAISEVSVYFRDLHAGPVLGINEHTEFTPASLLKVPLAIAYLSIGEENPEFFQTELMYKKIREAPNQAFPPREVIKENTRYSIDELLRRMIVYSDNLAYFTLEQYLKDAFPERKVYLETVRRLGIIADTDNPDEFITVKSYASIFVQLYHSTFFDNKETSEKILEMLAQSDFKGGLAAGLPQNIETAHKFGERFIAGDIKQFHDCGIIYYPDNPYLLCVMTRGKDFQKLAETIGEISKMVYEEVDSRKL